MAIVTRYFSTSSAGAADGTTWADRAQLINAGTWSSVITAFDFSGTDSLKCLIGPGTYTVTSGMASGLFSVAAPTVVNPIIFHSCDSSGNQQSPPDPDWTSAQPVFDDSGFPVFATTTNVSTFGLSHSIIRLFKFTASGTTGNPVIAGTAAISWCTIYDSASSTSAYAVSNSATKVSNCYVIMTGASYRAAYLWSTNQIINCRASGIGGGGTSGNRHGIEFTGANGASPIERCCIFGFAGDGIGTSSGGTGHVQSIIDCIIANCGGDGIALNATASQTAQHRVEGCMLTGNGAHGIDAQSAAYAVMSSNRLRDNTSGNIGNAGNYPTDLDNYTTDSDDATEYVDATTTYDFRIKNSAGIWGSGYGVSDQPAAGGSANLLHGKMG